MYIQHLILYTVYVTCTCSIWYFIQFVPIAIVTRCTCVPLVPRQVYIPPIQCAHNKIIYVYIYIIYTHISIIYCGHSEIRTPL